MKCDINIDPANWLVSFMPSLWFFYPVWAQDWLERKHWPSSKHVKALKWLDREIQCGS